MNVERIRARSQRSLGRPRAAAAALLVIAAALGSWAHLGARPAAAPTGMLCPIAMSDLDEFTWQMPSGRAGALSSFVIVQAPPPSGAIVTDIADGHPDNIEFDVGHLHIGDTILAARINGRRPAPAGSAERWEPTGWTFTVRQRDGIHTLHHTNVQCG